MTIKELQSKTESELQDLLADNRWKLKDLRFKNANGQLKDVREVRETKQDIARVLTVLNASKASK
jgi:ribosomal protein L29